MLCNAFTTASTILNPLKLESSSIQDVYSNDELIVCMQKPNTSASDEIHHKHPYPDPNLNLYGETLDNLEMLDSSSISKGISNPGVLYPSFPKQHKPSQNSLHESLQDLKSLQKSLQQNPSQQVVQDSRSDLFLKLIKRAYYYVDPLQSIQDSIHKSLQDLKRKSLRDLNHIGLQNLTSESLQNLMHKSLQDIKKELKTRRSRLFKPTREEFKEGFKNPHGDLAKRCVESMAELMQLKMEENQIPVFGKNLSLKQKYLVWRKYMENM